MKQLRSFQTTDMAKAFAIVNVFETGRPFGGFASLAVLNDGAGISYGISQFTHRSGALFEVVSRYLASGDGPEHRVIHESLPLLSLSDERSIRTAAADRRLKQALIAAAATPAMRRSQFEVAFSRYLAPAIAACAGSDFRLPLSLAVIYDSINHGSYEKIRDRVSIAGMADGDAGRFEREWIASYVTTRHLWLGRVARLRPTQYRTRFFLDQIGRENWRLDLPLNVHGVRIDSAAINEFLAQIADGASGEHASASEPSADSAKRPAVNTGLSPSILSRSSQNGRVNAAPAENGVRTPDRSDDDAFLHLPSAAEILETVESGVNSAAREFDRVEAVLMTVARRNDAAKSMWTTVIGSLWQTVWAVISFAAGLPAELWLFAAAVAAVLTLFYLYRQIELGRIRERGNKEKV